MGESPHLFLCDVYEPDGRERNASPGVLHFNQGYAILKRNRRQSYGQ